jgi:hypothetical protein
MPRLKTPAEQAADQGAPRTGKARKAAVVPDQD